MNTQAKNHHFKIIVLLGLIISGLVYAVATFWPSTTPTVTLGEYALKDRDLLDGPTRAYRPWFENGAWQGDIIEYIIGQDGSRTTDANVGSNPPTATGSNWMARATFRAKGADDPNSTYWKNRQIVTYVNGAQVDFWWDNLTVEQKQALDLATLNDPNGDGLTDDAADPAANQGDEFSPTLNFIRGDRSQESDQPGGTLRKRYSVLGDITITPLYVGPPRELLGSMEGFSEFRLAYENRAGFIASPSNDGMLHFLAEADGAELLAYIPSMVIDKLPRLKERGYEHTYYVNGELTAGSAQIGATTCTAADVSGCGWSTVITSGGGHGFEGLIALNLTTPLDPTVLGYASNRVLFEKTVDGDGDAIGQIYGPPRIAPLGTLASPDWFIFTGNGHRTVCTGPDITCDTDITHPTKLLMVSLDYPNAVYDVDTGATGGLSSPALLSSDTSDVLPEVAFAGDINGDLWMFKINKANPSASTAHRVFDGSPNQPITNTPAIVEHPTEPGYMVYFGTGSLFSETDAADDSNVQAIYGIWIKQEWINDPTNILSPLTSGQLRVQQLNSTPVTGTFNGEVKNLRTVPNDLALNYSCAVGDSACEANKFPGWTVSFPNCGERLLGSPFARAGRIQFVTSNPSGADPDNCSALQKTLTGDSWVMSLNFLTGGSAGEIVYNLNGDNDLDSADTANGVPPVGLGLGQGNIAQPAFVRLTSGIDKMFINGIILPFPPVATSGPFLFGHVDVVTDSPVGGKKAPNVIDKHSEGYYVDVGDGLGKAVDGHVHAYDTIHGISYVDLMELEPRRGLASLAASATDPDNNGDCSDEVNSKEIKIEYEDADGNPVTRCVEEVEPELNRAYDTLKTEVENVSPSGDPLACPDDYDEVFNDEEPPELVDCVRTVGDPESEVYVTTPSGEVISADQEFIVAIANADLSSRANLQVGCRIWRGTVINADNTVSYELIEYQDHLAAELEKGTPLAEIRDPKYGEPVVYTMAGILADEAHVCPDESPNPTLRVLFQDTDIFREGIIGTRAQCVLGLHNPREQICYPDYKVLQNPESAIIDTQDLIDTLGPQAELNCSGGTAPTTDIPDRYIKDPALNLHITENRDGTGYRWRNGALTVQLLKVSAGIKAFEVQEVELPEGKGNTGRIGGIFARAFTAVTQGNGSDKMTYFTTYDDGDHSGLLYEAAVFWHYSDLADNIQSGDPRSVPCYGDPNYGGSVAQELRGLVLGQYNVWADALRDSDDLGTVANLLNALADDPTEDQIAQIMAQLDELLENNEELAAWWQYRDYVPGSNIPDQHLLDIDKNLIDPGGGTTTTDDAVPAEVVAIETIDLETLGPNAVLGRRNWIDVRQ